MRLPVVARILCFGLLAALVYALLQAGSLRYWSQALPAVSITLTQPDGSGDSVAEGDDFATLVLGSPWDMTSDPYPDFPSVLGTFERSSLVVSGGEWRMRTVNGDPRVYIHYTGLAQPVMKMGNNGFAIDTGNYKLLSFRMCLSSAAGSGQIYWYYTEIYTKFAGSNFFPVLEGCHVYVVDLTQIGTNTLAGGATGWNGNPIGLAIDPVSDGSNIEVRMDWIRLTTADTSQSFDIQWTDLDQAGATVEFYLDEDDSGHDGTKIGQVTSASRSGTFSWGSALRHAGNPALPYPLPESFEPGQYYVYAKVCGTDAGYSSGPLTIDAAPILEFTSPSRISGQDYATYMVYNPWDMSDSADIAATVDIASSSFSDGVYNATTGSTGDSQVLFQVTTPIDTSTYKHLTYRMYREGTQDIGLGWVARVYWWNVGPSQDYVVTHDIVDYEGWQTYSVDLSQAILEPDSRGTGWHGTQTALRLDPHEMLNSATLHLDYVMLTGDPTGKTDASVPIWYELSEQDNVTVTLYYDTDTNPSNGKTLIGTYQAGTATQNPGLSAPSAGSLDVTKHVGPEPVQSGAPLTYTLRVTNTGSVSLTATITDILPTHVAPTGVLTWTPTITAPNSVWVEAVVVTVEMGYSGLLTNVVQVTTDEGASGIYTATSAVSYTLPNQAPYTPSSPTPEDGDSSVPVTQILSWQGGDPDQDAVTYTVAFGTSDPPPVAGTTTLTSYVPALASGTTYYWRITASDGISASVGSTWRFTTVVIPPPNQAPYTPSNPAPADGASSVPVDQVLSWQGGDPDGDPVTYTVAFGTSDPPPVVGTTTPTSYAPALASGTTYYWRITASDGISTSVGSTWSLTTADPTAVYLPLVMRRCIATDLPKPSGIQVLWDTTGVPAGTYYILAEVADGYNTTRWYSELPVVLTDQ